MADFNQALAPVLQNEGGYANNPNDPGGETFRGVARRFWPQWIGWPRIDEARSRPGFPATINQDETLLTDAKNFYLKNFWRFDGLKDQDVAEKVLDISVNLGLVRAVKLLQLAIRQVNKHSALRLDGQYGPDTERETNACDSKALLHELRARQALHYALNSKKEFLPELMRRAVL